MAVRIPDNASKPGNEVITTFNGPDSDMELGHLDTASKHSKPIDDIKDMRRMGKKQVLNRTFRQTSITSFVCLATASWEVGLLIISPALIDGGRAGLVWNSLWCWIGFLPIYLSMVCCSSTRTARPNIFELQLSLCLDHDETTTGTNTAQLPGRNVQYGSYSWSSVSLGF